MKVLYLLRYYPTLTETFVAQEVAGVAARGIETAIASIGRRSDGDLYDQAPDVPVYELPRRPLTWRFRRQSRGQQWLTQHQRAKDAARLPGLTDIARGFDRIHVHFAGEAAEMAHALHLDTGIPYTVTVHAADLFKPRASLAAVLRKAEHVITISAHNQATLGAMAINARLVRCGPDLHRLQPQPSPDGPLRALFIGRDVPKKGLDILLDAWSGLDRPTATLQLVTDATVRAPPAGVECLGFQPPSVIPDLLARAHLLVLPCRRAPDGDMDGIPLTLMEALAMGRPVVTTPISGIPELVDHTVGWLVPTENPRALRRTLQDVADDLPLAARKGAAGPHQLRHKGYHLASQVDGVVAAWEGRGSSTEGMAADSGTVE